MSIENASGPHLHVAGKSSIAHNTSDGSWHLPKVGSAIAGMAPILQADKKTVSWGAPSLSSVAWGAITGSIAAQADLANALATLSASSIQDRESFPKGDSIWQVDPGGLWDSGLCFVHVIPVKGRAKLVYIDFEFGAVGSGTDGAWAVWGGVDATGAWTLLSQGALPNTSKGIVRYTLPAEIELAGYDLLAIAQDPGAVGVAQPVRQTAMYYPPNPPSGMPAAYSYLGMHSHGSSFTLLPTIPGADAIYLMQKWTSIGVR